MIDEHERWMREAIAEADKAARMGDIPIGAVIVRDGEIIGRGYNRKEADADPTSHAEIIALREAARRLGDWRLEGCTLYCTLEPCAMCAGAMIHARLPKLVFAAWDPKAGAGGSVMDLLHHPVLNHQVEVIQGPLAEKATQQIRDFFAGLRAQGKK